MPIRTDKMMRVRPDPDPPPSSEPYCKCSSFVPTDISSGLMSESCVLQVFLLRNDSRLLICTPSNSSADLIAECLILSKRYRMFMFSLYGYVYYIYYVLPASKCRLQANVRNLLLVWKKTFFVKL